MVVTSLKVNFLFCESGMDLEDIKRQTLNSFASLHTPPSVADVFQEPQGRGYDCN